MNFKEYVVFLVVLYVVYYIIVISYDIYKQNRIANGHDGTEVEINISQAVEQYQPINAGTFIDEGKDSAVSMELDEDDVRAGLDDPPYDQDDVAFTDEEGGGGDAQLEDDSLVINNVPGITAKEFKDLVNSTIEEGGNFFKGLLVEEIR